MKRISRFCLLISLAAFFSGRFIDVSLEEIQGKLNDYLSRYPQEKVYLHLDKPVYAAGESLWFSTYLVNAGTHQLDSVSQVIHVELYNSANKLLQKEFIYSPKGRAQGDMRLPDTLSGGTYFIRAYTNYMKNLSNDYFFTRKIPVVSRNRAKKNKSLHMIPDVQFFPEGGNLIAGVENRVGFKAINENGLGVEVDGEVTDDAGKVVATFTTDYAGMGTFSFTPKADHHYTATIDGNKKAFDLPGVMPNGYLMRAVNMSTHYKIIVYRNFPKPAPTPVFLVGLTRGLESFSAKIEMKSQSFVFNVSKSRLRTGITQITLFDENGLPQCERLVFVNHQDPLQFSINVDKESYKDREKVSLDVTVSTKDGKPVDGTFSLSAYDDLKIEEQENFPATITENLLLTSDLTGYIENPAYYLKDTLPETQSRLDLLMMTHGWRRFSWKEIVQGTVPNIKFLPEQGITLSGKALRMITRKPVQNATIKIITSKGHFMSLQTDSLGAFNLPGFIYYDTIKIAVQTDNKKGHQTDYQLELNSLSGIPMKFVPRPFDYFNAEALIDQTEARNKTTRGYADSEDAIMLNEIEIKGKREEKNPNTRMKVYGSADATIAGKDLQGAYTDVLQVLRGKVAGLTVEGGIPRIRGSRSFGYGAPGSNEPLYLLDGIQVDLTMIQNIPIINIESIDVLKTPDKTVIYGSRGANGVIAVYTKPGINALALTNKSLRYITYPGLSRAREFYTPRYDHTSELNNLMDIRSTLYWNPSVQTDRNGKAHITFFTSDIKSEYKIQIEGISQSGTPGAGYGKLVVQ